MSLCLIYDREIIFFLEEGIAYYCYESTCAAREGGGYQQPRIRTG